MTAPARQGASPEPSRRAGPSPSPAGVTAASPEAVGPVTVSADRASPLLWAVVIVVMVLATAATVGILLLQWLSTSSGTVGR